MVESSRKRKTQTSARRHRGVAANELDEIIAPSQPRRLFSSVTQYERYSSKTEFYDILHNLGLLPFLTNRQCYYPELVRVFYSNLQITNEGVIITEVKNIQIRMDINMFYRITKLGTQGVYFEGNMVEEWRDDYSSHNAKLMIYRDNVNIRGRILAGQMKVETFILHYIICRLLPRTTNFAEATKEDIILMWAMLIERELN